MSFDLVNNIFNDVKNNKFVQNFIKDLQNYLENSKLKRNNINIKEEEITLCNPTNNGNKIISKYRDKMYAERIKILNNYSKQTLDKGKMYYIYSKNSRLEDYYNLCICEEGKSNIVIQESKSKLPSGSGIGSVLRMSGKDYVLDLKSTQEIEKEIYKMEDILLEKQKDFLESKRIEGHIYEIFDKDCDRAWLFDITNNSSEGIEEIDLPEELLKYAKEKDRFIYKNGKYQKIIF